MQNEEEHLPHHGVENPEQQTMMSSAKTCIETPKNFPASMSLSAELIEAS